MEDDTASTSIKNPTESVVKKTTEEVEKEAAVPKDDSTLEQGKETGSDSLPTRTNAPMNYRDPSPSRSSLSKTSSGDSIMSNNDSDDPAAQQGAQQAVQQQPPPSSDSSRKRKSKEGVQEPDESKHKCTLNHASICYYETLHTFIETIYQKELAVDGVTFECIICYLRKRDIFFVEDVEEHEAFARMISPILLMIKWPSLDNVDLDEDDIISDVERTIKEVHAKACADPVDGLPMENAAAPLSKDKKLKEETVAAVNSFANVVAEAFRGYDVAKKNNESSKTLLEFYTEGMEQLNDKPPPESVILRNRQPQNVQRLDRSKKARGEKVPLMEEIVFIIIKAIVDEVEEEQRKAKERNMEDEDNGANADADEEEGNGEGNDNEDGVGEGEDGLDN